MAKKQEEAAVIHEAAVAPEQARLRPNRAKYSVELSDGKEYPLRYSIAALEALAAECDFNILDPASSGKRLTAEVVAHLAHRGIVAANPDVTLEYVQNNIDAPNILYTIQQVMDAMSGRMPETLDPTKTAQN